MFGGRERASAKYSAIIIITLVNFIICGERIKVEFCSCRVRGINSFEDIEDDRGFIQVGDKDFLIIGHLTEVADHWLEKGRIGMARPGWEQGT